MVICWAKAWRSMYTQTPIKYRWQITAAETATQTDTATNTECRAINGYAVVFQA
jgi:hypothetical protein